MLLLIENQSPWLVRGLVRKCIPPSLTRRSLPAASNIISRESLWGEVLFRVPEPWRVTHWLPDGCAALHRNIAVSPPTYTMLVLVGSTASDKCRAPWPMGWALGTSIDVQLVPASVDRKRPARCPALTMTVQTLLPRPV